MPMTPTFQQLASSRVKLTNPSPSPGTKMRISPKSSKPEYKRCGRVSVSGKKGRLEGSFGKEECLNVRGIFPSFGPSFSCTST